MKFVVEILTRGVDYPRFRQLYHSERFNLEVAAEANLVERSLQEFVTEAGGTERRRVRVVPRVNLPPVIQRLLDEDTGATILRYDEVTVFDPVTRSATFAIQSAVGGVSVTGVARYIEAPEGVHLQIEGEANVKFAVVGAILERYLVREVKARYEVVERVLQRLVDGGLDPKRTTGGGGSGPPT